MPRIQELVVTLALLACSCASSARTGSVHLSQPEVFRRERLVAQRVSDVQWLESLYDEDEQSGFSGKSDVRTSRTTSLSLEAGLQDVAGSLFGDGSGAGAPPAGDGGVAGASTAASGGDAGDQPDAAPPSEDGKQGLPSPAVMDTTAERTPIERLRNRIAYHEVVSAAIRERMLDDAHDRQGMAMYDLGMYLNVDATGEENGPLVVSLKLGDELPRPDAELWTPEELEPVYRGLLARMTKDISRNHESLVWSLQERTLQLGTEEATAYVAALSYGIDLLTARAANPEFDGWLPLDKEREGTLKLCLWARNCILGRNEFDRLTADMDQEALHRNWVLAAAWAAHFRFMSQMQIGWVRARYPRVYGPIDPPELAWSPDRGLLEKDRAADVHLLGTSTLVFNRDAFGAFYAALKTAIGSLQPYVVQVDPKEVVQDVSRVGAREETTETALKVAYLLNNLGLKADADSVWSSLRSLQAIDRLPVILGYGSGRSSFGWLLGPRFGIDPNGNEQNRHASASYAVSVRLVVPLLWKRVDLSGDYRWYSELREGWLARALGGDDRGSALIRTETLSMKSVDLPLDEIALEGLLRNQYSRLRGPQIFEVIGDLREGLSAQDLLILGKDLWRSPQVFFGGRKADEVEILADMRGLRATFKNLRLAIPPSVGAGEVSQSLTVVTSEGQTQYTYLVRAYRAAGPQAFVTGVRRPYLLGKSPVELLVNPDLAPFGHSGMMLTLRPEGGAWWSKEIRPTIKTLDGSMVYSFDPGEPPVAAGGKDLQVLEVGLMMRMEPGGDFLRVPMDAYPRVVFFKDASVASPLAKPSAIEFDKATKQTGGKLDVHMPSAESLLTLPELELASRAPKGAWSAFLVFQSGDVKESIELSLNPDVGPKDLRVGTLGATELNALRARPAIDKLFKDQKLAFEVVLELRGGPEATTRALQKGVEFSQK